MEKGKIPKPRVFISYSQTSKNYSDDVRRLADLLIENGVDVILDQYELKEGADVNAFMEQMVNDVSIDKVLILCDKRYAEKANGRIGGVGAETAIISGELYNQTKPASPEQRFIPIITERDESGDPYLPHYIKSRLHIDMSAGDYDGEPFEQLVRCVYNKPNFEKPEIGEPPSYIIDGTHRKIRNTTLAKKANKSLRIGESSQHSDVRDFFEKSIEQLNDFKINAPISSEFDDEVIKSIDELLPYRNQVVDVIVPLARQQNDAELFYYLHNYFEKLYAISQRPDGKKHYTDVATDNFGFLANELFIYTISASLLEYNQDLLKIMMGGYYFDDKFKSSSDSMMVPFYIFNSHTESLNIRNKRLQLRRICLHADLIKNRATRKDVSFKNLMEADLFLYIFSILHNESDEYGPWFPRLLTYAVRERRPFELFSRAEYTRHSSRLLQALQIQSIDELRVAVRSVLESDSVPKFDYNRIHLDRLLNIERLGAK